MGTHDFVISRRAALITAGAAALSTAAALTFGMRAAAAPHAVSGNLGHRANWGWFYPPQAATPVNHGFHAAEALVGVRFTHASTFADFDSIRNPTGHDAEWRDLIATGHKLNVALMPKATGRTVLFSDILAGVYDPDLLAYFRWLRGLPTDEILLRFAHEMNGDWYPWSPAYQKPDKGCVSAAQYVAVWQYLYRLERSLGPNGTGSNIKWFWCANFRDGGAAGVRVPMEQFYPGPSYVNAVGGDLYNFNENNQNWKPFGPLLLALWQRIRAFEPNKMWAVGEYGCVKAAAGQTWVPDPNDIDPATGKPRRVPADRGQWFRDAVAYIGVPTHTARMVFCYFDDPNSSKNIDGDSTSVQGARDAFQPLVNPTAQTDYWGVLPA